MSLGQSDPWVHCVMGLTHFVSKEPDEAIAQFKKALDLNPSFALAHAYLGAQLAHAGEPEEAIEAATQAIRLSPRDPELFHFYVASGTASFVARRYHDAVDWAKKALREKPDVPSAHRLLVASYGQLGQSADAEAALKEALGVTPHLSVTFVRATIHFKNATDAERYIEGLTRAGLR